VITAHCGSGRLQLLASDPEMFLQLSDAAYAERLAAFLTSLGQRPLEHGPGRYELNEELDDLELAIYLRVWDVLYPEAPVSVEGSAFPHPADEADTAA
jgi:hypothetical protein